MNESRSGFFRGGGLTLIVVVLVWGIGGYGKYEGQTAEEWYSSYDEAETSLSQCRSQFEEVSSRLESLEPEILKLDDCMKGNTKFGTDLLQRCKADPKNTEESCVKLLVALAQGKVEMDKDCITSYLQNR